MAIVFNLDELMYMVCRSGARAIYRYAEVAGMISGEDNPGLFMPESFVGGFVLNELGGEITASLETNATTLWRFNQNAKGSSLNMRSELTNQRVDLVLYQDLNGSAEKSAQGIFLLMEFKLLRGLDGSDRSKLENILKYIDTCPYGAVLSVLKSSQVQGEEAQAAATGDRWYRCDVAELPHKNQERFSVCARAFAAR